MPPQYARDASRAELVRKLADAEHRLQDMSARLQTETERADRAVKSAADAWLFARTALRTSHSRGGDA